MRPRSLTLFAALGSLATAASFAACAGGDADATNAALPPGWAFDAGSSDASDAPDSAASFDGSTALPAFTPPSDPGPSGVLFTASGEALALSGVPFPPSSVGAAAFVDGWDVRFEQVLVTVDAIRVSSTPDAVPGDPSITGGVVAEVAGPWAVDLAKDDPSYLMGKGGPGERAVPLAALAPGTLATDGTRYAFGFDVGAATRGAANVNLGPAALDAYGAAIAEGCSVYYAGRATFRGGTVAGHESCATDPAFAGWPTEVEFRLCFATPTTYANCQNPDNDPAEAFPGEEHERGFAPRPDTSVVEQLTMHLDHPFWDSLVHGSPPRFDAYAARAVGRDGGVPVVTLASLRGVDYTAITDALGRPVKARACVDPPIDVHAPLVGALSYDPASVPHATGDDPSTGLRDLADFVSYVQSTQGHLNSDGLCAVRRRYASPR